MTQFIFFLAVVDTFGLRTYGQSTILKSSVDESLSIKTVTVAPFLDNVSQIYGKPLSGQMRGIIEEDKQWDLRSFPENIKTTPEEYEDQPTLVQAALKKANADALVTGRIAKSSKGISIRLNLFTGNEGLLLTQEILQDFSGFEISEVRAKLAEMFFRLKSRLPYSGVILSRRGQLMTINMGKNQGVRENMELSVVQIIKFHRHPKFHFIISAEKEIIGRIHIDKTEEALSFGTLIMERSENVIQPGMKVIPVGFIEYPLKPKGADGQLIEGLATRPDSAVSLGENQPQEWIPLPTPSLGKIALLLGLGDYVVSNTLSSVGGVDGTASIAPSFHVEGELWLTTNWFLALDLRQYIATISNRYPGSSPGMISVSTLQTSLQLGYSFLLNEQFFGPKIQLLGGYSKLSSSLDNSSPVAYTSMNFGGFAVGLAGSVPVSEETPLTLGAKMMYYLNPGVSESPVSSGSSSSAQISSFSGFGTYRWTEHINLRGEIQYDLYRARFSGTGTRGADSASSASHTMTTLAGGVEFLF